MNEGGSMRGPGGGSFNGDPGGCVKEGSGDGHLSPKGPHSGTWKGAHLPGPLKGELRRTLGLGYLSLREIYEGHLDGGTL
jgi:hypothetical protein